MIMKKYLYMCLIGIVAISCEKRQEIPLDIFGEIIQETILTYSTIQNVPELKDSVENMDYYSPVLEKYGYTVADMEYTIEAMISRKSKILSVTLNKAHAKIELKKSMAEYFYDISTNFNLLVKRNYVDTLYKIYPKYKFKNNSKIDSTVIYLPIDGAGQYLLRIYYASYSLPKDVSYYVNTRVLDSLSNVFSYREQSNRYIYNKTAKKRIDDAKKKELISSIKDDSRSAVNAKVVMEKKKTKKELREELKYSGIVAVSWDFPDKNKGNVIEINLFSKIRSDVKKEYNVKKTNLNKTKLVMPDIEIDSIILTRIPNSEAVFREILRRENGFLMLEDYSFKVDSFRMPYVDINLDFVDTIPRYVQDTSGYDMMLNRHFTGLMKNNN